MSQLEWSESLALGLPAMDDTHREFVDLLGQVALAADAALTVRWAALIAHTQDHFGREDQWMQSTGFSSSNCHSTQHTVVLQVMREGLAQAQAGDVGGLRQMAHELGQWFAQHAQSMDAALALHLRSTGFDPQTGVVHMPQSLAGAAVQGCGGAGCSDLRRAAVPVAEAA